MWIKVRGVGLEGDLQQVGLRWTSHQQLVKDVCWILCWVPDPVLTSSLSLSVLLFQPQSAVLKTLTGKMHFVISRLFVVFGAGIWSILDCAQHAVICRASEANPAGPGVATDGAQAVRLRTGRPFLAPSENSTHSWNWTLERMRPMGTFPLGRFSFLQPCRTENDISLARPEGGRKGACEVESSLGSGKPDSGPNSCGSVSHV